MSQLAHRPAHCHRLTAANADKRGIYIGLVIPIPLNSEGVLPGTRTRHSLASARKSRRDERSGKKKSPQREAPAASFPLFPSAASVGMCTFCDALSRHVSFHSPRCLRDIKALEQAVIVPRMATSQESSAGEPALQNNTAEK